MHTCPPITGPGAGDKTSVPGLATENLSCGDTCRGVSYAHDDDQGADDIHSRTDTFFTIHGETDKIPRTRQGCRPFHSRASDHRHHPQLADRVVHPDTTPFMSLSGHHAPPLHTMYHHQLVCFQECRPRFVMACSKDTNFDQNIVQVVLG